MNILHTKKFRHGSVSLALTIVIVAAVILFNAIFSALANKYLWFVDMTSEQIYSLTDDARALLDTMDTEKEVEIIFCTAADIMEANATQRFALYTARDIAESYSNVKIKHVDVMVNPSAVNKYKVHTGNDINSQSIIVASGTECRVYALNALYNYDSNTQEAIGYNGEQRLVSGILAVTQVEMPVACITTNHGEKDNANIEVLANLLYETGYDVKAIDLSKEVLPEDCRLVVVYDPQTDFIGRSTTSDVSELEKLDAFLDKKNAMMVFFDYETPELPAFEAFLDEWGIAIARHEDSNVLIRDLENSFTTSGYTNVASYVSGTGVGSSVTSPLTKDKYPKSVVFPYTTAIASTYEALYNDSAECWTGYYYKNGVERNSYDVFTSSVYGEAIANEQKLKDSELNEIGLANPHQMPFSYMKITQETFIEDGKETYAYVLACASTQFCTADALSSSYGNHTVLAYACSIMGRDMVAVSLDCKYFGQTEISNITSVEANQYTIVLTVVPAAIIFIAGVYIMVRRKYA